MPPYQQAASVQTAPPAVRKSGVYGLFRLDGGPVDRRAAAALGLTCETEQESGLLEAVDTADPAACARLDEGGIVTVFAGFLSDPAVLIAELGLPATACPARIARAALARFGAQLPARLFGEWSLLQWDRAEGSVTVMGSAARRDPICYARSGPNLAIAPDLFALSRIDWVGAGRDDQVMLISFAQFDLRRGFGDRTIFRSVSRLANGTGLTFRGEAEPIPLRCDLLAGTAPFGGTALDALEQAEALLRQIMHERLARAGSAAVLLSGGLDSSLLTWAGADAGARLLAFTSAMPPGSATPDELAEAALVAATLGLQHAPVFPGPELDSYRPAPAILASSNGPSLANRHCLTATFQQTARAHGVGLLINGTYGEGTLTARLPEHWPIAFLRSLARRVLRPGSGSSPDPSDVFHIRLAPALLARLPDEVAAAVQGQHSQAQADAQPGLAPVLIKALAHPNEFQPGAVRMDFPFRDLRLLRLFASFPAELLRALGPDRGLARRMLAGRLPDAIVQRRRGRPADPDHYARLQRQAPAARGRIAAFRQAGLDAMLDLDWLDGELSAISANGVHGVLQANQVQLTAMSAEFLLWLQDR